MTHVIKTVRPDGIVVYQCGQAASDTLLSVSPLEATCGECVRNVARELRPVHMQSALIGGVA
jgi:hypothetical protein